MLRVWFESRFWAQMGAGGEGDDSKTENGLGRLVARDKLVGEVERLLTNLTPL